MGTTSRKKRGLVVLRYLSYKNCSSRFIGLFCFFEPHVRPFRPYSSKEPRCRTVGRRALVTSAALDDIVTTITSTIKTSIYDCNIVGFSTSRLLALPLPRAFGSAKMGTTKMLGIPCTPCGTTGVSNCWRTANSPAERQGLFCDAGMWWFALACKMQTAQNCCVEAKYS